MRLLLTGAGGMLGRDVIRAGTRAGHELVGLAHAELDITDAGAVAAAVEEIDPDCAINCAAWTDVDGAEANEEQALAVNSLGAGNLARAATAAGATLVHVSSDYVFDGRPNLNSLGRPRPYLESDPTHPISVYGQTKLAGEQQVLEASPRHVVVRSSWLFGVDGPNFVATMLRLAGERDSVAVVTDQVGCPSWTGHLAPALIGLLERGISGVAHLAGAGEVSWNGFAKEIFRQAELDCRVDPATTAEMARPAPRPAFSALESEREEILPLPPWQDGLAGFLAAREGLSRSPAPGAEQAR
jgi:dTDP-4-dehydrorhamnose reductase